MAAWKCLLTLSLFSLSATAAVTVGGSRLPEGWSVLDACAVDVPSRLLKSFKIKNFQTNTPSDCVAYCDSLGYTHAGVEYGQECHCGRGFDLAAARSAPVAECNQPCAGDPSQKCGGRWRIEVYVSTSKLPSSPILPDGWSTAYGCAVDSGDRILLNAKKHVMSKTNTPAACIKLCDSLGSTHAGVEYGSECYCGIGYRSSPVSAPIEACDMACTGDSYYNCGSRWRMSIYTLDSASPPTTPPAPATSSVALSGVIGVYNKATDQLIGYIKPANSGANYVLGDKAAALNVQFKISSVPNTPFPIRVADDSPHGYVGAVQPESINNQCDWCGEWVDELVNVGYSTYGKAKAVGNGYSDLNGGQHRSEATMWLFDPRTRVFEAVWVNDFGFGYQLFMYHNAAAMGTYMNADHNAWLHGARPGLGDVQVVYKLEGNIPRYTPTCRDVSGWEHTTADGSVYDVLCSKDFPGYDIGQPTTVADFAACMTRCSEHNAMGNFPACAAAEFLPSGIDLQPGANQCWLKSDIKRETGWLLSPWECNTAILKPRTGAKFRL